MRLHIVLTPLVGIFILARVFIRLRLETSLGLDDWAIVVAGIFYMGSAGIAFPITIMGYGQHTWYLPTSTIILSLKVCSSSLPNLTFAYYHARTKDTDVVYSSSTFRRSFTVLF